MFKGLKTKIKNYFFCKKYPFWKAYNVWTRKFCGYSFTEYDNIAKGWQIAFGKQLSKELKKVGKEELKRLNKESKDKKYKWKDILQFEQIKEKYGTLRLYASGTEKIQNILSKYESLSEEYCIHCGKPVQYRTKGWITFICEDCLRKEYEYGKTHRGLIEEVKSFEDYKNYYAYELTKEVRDYKEE